MARSRISGFGQDTFDPAIGWETIDFPDAAAYSTHQPSPGTPSYSRNQHQREYYSPDVTPPTSAGGRGTPGSLGFASPVSPAFTRTSLHPPSVAATAGPHDFQTQSHGRHSTLDHGRLPVSLSAGGRQSNRNSASYSIPQPPPPPPLPMDYDEGTDYANTKLMEHNRISNEGHLGMGSWSGVTRHPSIARRLGDKILGTVRGRHGRMHSGGYIKSKGVVEYGDTEMRKPMGSYLKVDERDEDEPLGYDISSLGGADFVPAPAAKAMEDHKMDSDYAYTGTGEAIDLSTFGGLGGSQNDSDSFSLGRAGTMENTDKQSYYFPPNREIPNWKPISMRWWFIAGLLLCSLALICCVEALYQFSDRGLIQENKKPGIISFNRVDRDMGIVAFAMWKYFPTLIAVIYGILWKITDTEVKRTEPYYQLSRGSKGALAASTLNIEYQTFWSLLVPIAAIRHKQWLVVASSIASLLAFAVVPVLLSVFIEISPSQRQRKKMGVPDETVEKTIVVDNIFSRLLEATVGIIIFLGVGMIVALSRRKSGLLGDPSGIAGVAAMANKAHILMDFKDLDLASEETIHKQLNKRTYLLHRGALWRAQFLKENERDVKAPRARNAHPLLLRLKGGILFIAILAIVGALLPLLANGPLGFVVDKTPWVLTLISVLIKSLWEIVEKDLRMLEPFWVLFNRHARSSVLTLDYSATIPGYLVLKAASKGHFLLAWVGLVSLLVEVLTVVMGSLDGTGGEESDLSFKVSFILAVGILCVTILTMAIVLYFRHKPFLPRQPGTISSVLAFIHQSKMLVDFEGTEEKSTAERKKKLRSLKRTYGFGWFWGRDGKRHLGIDHEELLQGYEFGKRLLDGVLDPTESPWDQFEV